MLWRYKFYFCHWAVVVKESFFNPLSLIQLVFRRLVTAFLTKKLIHSFGLFLFSVMVQKMIEHLEYLVRYMCKTKIKFTND